MRKSEELKSDIEFVSGQFITAPLPSDWSSMKTSDLYSYLESVSTSQYKEVSGERILREIKASAVKLRAYFTLLRALETTEVKS